MKQLKDRENLKYLFIVNPKAGNGKALKSIGYINKYMSDKNLSFDFIYTEKPKDGIALVTENIDKYDIFVALGGDGTINEVAEGISINGKGILSIIPLGTGNDLAKVVYKKAKLKEVLDIITSGEIKEMDICRVNHGYFFNVASIGLDAQVIVNYNQLNRFKGKIKYIFSVFYTIFNFIYRNLEIDIDGKNYNREITLVAMGNGKYYGGFFKILPDANIDDGKLHICIVKKVDSCKIFFLAPLLLFGFHKNISKYVEISKCDKILIKSKKPYNLNLDGEILEKTRIAEIRIDGKIKVIY